MPFRRKYNPTSSQIQSIFSLIRKLFVKKSELLTFGLQKRGSFAVLVGDFQKALEPQHRYGKARRAAQSAPQQVGGGMAFKCHRSPRHQPPDHNTGQQHPPAKVVDEEQKRPGRAARVPAGAPVKHAVAQGKEQRREKIPGTDGADLRRDPRQQRPQKGNGIPHPGKDKRQLPLTLPAAAAGNSGCAG